MKKNGDKIIKGIKKFFSFLYKAGEINKIIWIMKNGAETRKEVNKEILRLDTKTSGNEVKIILWLGEFSNNEKRGLVSTSPRYLTLKKKKIKLKKRNRKLNKILFLNSAKWDERLLLIFFIKLFHFFFVKDFLL